MIYAGVDLERNINIVMDVKKHLTVLFTLLRGVFDGTLWNKQI